MFGTLSWGPMHSAEYSQKVLSHWVADLQYLHVSHSGRFLNPATKASGKSNHMHSSVCLFQDQALHTDWFVYQTKNIDF